MKVVQVGLGSFGMGWYRRLRREPGLTVAVVDTDPRAQTAVAPEDRFHSSLELALADEQPDFILNTTPPGVHTAVNLIAFELGIPVLCEKPIAIRYADAERAVAAAEAHGVPFMIAENYRRFPHMRKARQLIEAGALGELSTLHVDFRRAFHTDKPYFLALGQPLVVDVSIHHFDLMRYLSSAEVRASTARTWNPKGSSAPGAMAAWVLFEMDSGAMITYNGSMAARPPETTWSGNWRIEGSYGTLEIVDDALRLHSEQAVTTFTTFEDVDQADCLDAFLGWLRDGVVPETTATDYLRTQAMVEAVIDQGAANAG